nr:hypothetical protein [uncultured Porphyromonas sp.]
MPGTGETTTSPTMLFSESYEGVLVQFKVKRGTIDELRSIGVSDGHPLINQHFGKMPNNQDIGGGWNTSKARFKVETLLSSKKKQINISLGKGEALDRFNSNIIEFKKIKDIEL